MPGLSYVRNFLESDRKNGAFKKKHVINFKAEKEPKMKFFDCGAFQNKMQMPSHDKIIFHMFLGHVILLPVTSIKRHLYKSSMTYHYLNKTV